MRRFIYVALAGLFAIAALTACGTSEGSGEEYDPSAPGGPGLTYNGKLGYDMGGGLVMPYDGSGVGLGMGY